MDEKGEKRKKEGKKEGKKAKKKRKRKKRKKRKRKGARVKKTLIKTGEKKRGENVNLNPLTFTRIKIFI